MARIVLDLRWVRSDVLDGIARVSLCYAAELLRREDHDYVLLFANNRLKTFCMSWIHDYDANNDASRPLRSWCALVCGFDARSFLNRTRLPELLRPFSPEAYLSFYYIFHPVLPRSCRNFAMVHDLTPLKFPAYFKKASLLFRGLLRHPWGVKLLLSQAHEVITVSRSTRRDLQMLYRGSVHVVYPGVQVRVHTPLHTPLHSDIQPLLPDPYILQVGRADPHKNQRGTLRAYAALEPALRQQFTLVFAGPTDSRYTPALQAEAIALGVQDRVIFTGALSSTTLQSVYANAIVTVFPSFYEGFGLPVLEAMAQGVPVIVSEAASLPEVAGDAALYVNPSDTRALTQQLVEVLNSAQRRKYLIEKGLQRVPHFHWASTVDGFLKVLRTSLSSL